MEEVIGESSDDDYETLKKKVADDEELEESQLIECENVSSHASSNTGKSALPETKNEIMILDNFRPETEPSKSPFDLDQYVEGPDPGQNCENNLKASVRKKANLLLQTYTNPIFKKTFLVNNFLTLADLSLKLKMKNKIFLTDQG